MVARNKCKKYQFIDKASTGKNIAIYKKDRSLKLMSPNKDETGCRVVSDAVVVNLEVKFIVYYR